MFLDFTSVERHGEERENCYALGWDDSSILRGDSRGQSVRISVWEHTIVWACKAGYYYDLTCSSTSCTAVLAFAKVPTGRHPLGRQVPLTPCLARVRI